MPASLPFSPAELWQMLLTHLWLSGLALLASVAIAVPAAVLFARRRRAAEAVLHIRPGPAGDGSAESCGNAPAFNAVEILPCAERAPLHMGARPLKTDVLGRTAES